MSILLIAFSYSAARLLFRDVSHRREGYPPLHQRGERPLGAGLLEDTAKALRLLFAEATAAEEQISAMLKSEPGDPS